MYDNLKNNLPQGAINRIAIRLKVHRSQVWRVMTGKAVNTRILTELVKEADRYSELRRKAETL